MVFKTTSAHPVSKTPIFYSQKGAVHDPQECIVTALFGKGPATLHPKTVARKWSSTCWNIASMGLCWLQVK